MQPSFPPGHMSHLLCLDLFSSHIPNTSSYLLPFRYVSQVTKPNASQTALPRHLPTALPNSDLASTPIPQLQQDQRSSQSLLPAPTTKSPRQLLQGPRQPPLPQGPPLPRKTSVNLPPRLLPPFPPLMTRKRTRIPLISTADTTILMMIWLRLLGEPKGLDVP